MKSLQETKKLAANIFRLLKVTEISFPIGRTNRGELSLKFTKDKEDFEIIIDAVPISMNEYDNRELKSILTKKLFDKEESDTNLQHLTRDISDIVPVRETTPKKKGRPKGSKNKPKEEVNG